MAGIGAPGSSAEAVAVGVSTDSPATDAVGPEGGRRVVAAIGEGPSWPRVALRAAALAAGGGKVLLAHVDRIDLPCCGPPLDACSAPVPPESLSRAAELVEAAGAAHQVLWLRVPRDDLAGALLEAASAFDAEMIVAGKPVRRWRLWPSFPARLARRSRLPVVEA